MDLALQLDRRMCMRSDCEHHSDYIPIAYRMMTFCSLFLEYSGDAR